METLLLFQIRLDKALEKSAGGDNPLPGVASEMDQKGPTGAFPLLESVIFNQGWL